MAIAFGLTVSAQTVTISNRKVTYTRPKPIADFKKTFTIDHPRVKASTPALSRRIETLISHSTVLGLDLKEELNEIQWLEEADFEVLYNKNGLLAIELRMNGTGAYPSGSERTVVVDTRKGTRLAPSAVFRDLRGLSALTDNALQKEIAAAIKAIASDPANEEPDPRQLFEGKRFTIKDLDGFAVDETAVTFTYQYGFPHVIKALEPEGVFSFTWRELRPFIRPDGPLARFLR